MLSPFPAQKRVNANKYGCYADFAADVRLVFTNCLVFNHDPLFSRPIRDYGLTLLNLFDDLDEKAQGKPSIDNRLPQCRDLIEALLRARKHGSPDIQLAYPFVRPVDPVADNCADYHDVIDRPMDFGTIAVRRRRGEGVGGGERGTRGRTTGREREREKREREETVSETVWLLVRKMWRVSVSRTCRHLIIVTSLLACF